MIIPARGTWAATPGISTRRVAYVAHPVSGDVAGNLARICRWLPWLLTHHPEVSFCTPWFYYVMALDDRHAAYRERGMSDDLAILLRCDAIVLVGGTLSVGMRGELELATQAELAVIDYLHLGPEPPE
jgi:hypothetical protein